MLFCKLRERGPNPNPFEVYGKSTLQISEKWINCVEPREGYLTNLHIQAMSKSSPFCLSNISKIQPFLSVQTTKDLVQAFSSHMARTKITSFTGSVHCSSLFVLLLPHLPKQSHPACLFCLPVEPWRTPWMSALWGKDYLLSYLSVQYLVQ